MKMEDMENSLLEEIALWGAKALKVMIDSVYQTYDDEMSDELNVTMNEILINAQNLEDVLYSYKRGCKV